MNKQFFLFSITLLSSVNIMQTYLAVDKALWYGTIKFPSDIKVIPPVRVYYAGTKVHSEPEHEANQVTFAISEYKMRTTFYLIITDQVEFVSEQNTIKYLRVPKDHPYKLYTLVFKPNIELAQTKESDIDINEKGTWEITLKLLQDNRRIPDNAIIVCYHPHLVKTVQGGNALELPKIVLDDQILNKISPNELHDASIHFLLSSLNYDTIHQKADAQLKFPTDKTVLSLTT